MVEVERLYRESKWGGGGVGRERRRKGWDKLASFPSPAGGNEAWDKYTLDELLNCCKLLLLPHTRDKLH